LQSLLRPVSVGIESESENMNVLMVVLAVVSLGLVGIGSGVALYFIESRQSKKDHERNLQLGI